MPPSLSVIALTEDSVINRCSDTPTSPQRQLPQEDEEDGERLRIAVSSSCSKSAWNADSSKGKPFVQTRRPHSHRKDHIINTLTSSPGSASESSQITTTITTAISATTAPTSTTNTTKSCSTRRRLEKAVQWGQVRLYPITPLQEFPPSRIRDMWFQPSEYAAMAQENSHLIEQLMSHGALSAQDEAAGYVTSRGLEHMTQGEIQRRKRLRNEALDAVLNEQDRQYEREQRLTPTPEGVSRVYKPISVRAYEIAQRIGIKDAESAQAIRFAEESIHPKAKSSEDNDVALSAAASSATAANIRARLQQGHKVRFSPQVRVQLSLHLNEYTPKEMTHAYYSEQDIHEFKSSNKELLQVHLHSKMVPLGETRGLDEELIPDNSVRGDHAGADTILPSGTATTMKPTAVAEAEAGTSSFCIRGLEPYLVTSRQASRKENVRTTWIRVLDEQERQDQSNEFLPIGLAQASRDSSVECAREARRLAKQDERFVRRYCATEIQQWNITFALSCGRQRRSSYSDQGPINSNSDCSFSSPGTRPPSCTATPELDYRRDSLLVARKNRARHPTRDQDENKRGEEHVDSCIKSESTQTTKHANEKKMVALSCPPSLDETNNIDSLVGASNLLDCIDALLPSQFSLEAKHEDFEKR